MSNFYASTFFSDGARDGYAAVFSPDVQKSPPADPVHAAEYLAGWESGLKEGRAEAHYQWQEQQFYDRNAGL